MVTVKGPDSSSQPFFGCLSRQEYDMAMGYCSVVAASSALTLMKTLLAFF
jgi:hypothetical protein